MSPFAAGATDYTTYHFDNGRDGWNRREAALNHATVPRLKKSADIALDGEVDAQPLYLSSVYVPSLRARTSVVYVVTENDTLYAVAAGGGILWSRHYGAPVPTSVVGNCLATAPAIGIQGTPVIDERLKTIDFVSYTMEGGKPRYVLRAVDTGSGRERASADISRQAGDPSAERQRAGLLESAGRVYVAFAGFCDKRADVTFGRILAYDAATLRPSAAFTTTSSPRCEGVHYGTIWGLGFAPAADADGNVYFSTGNGCIDYARVPDGGYSDAVLRLTPSLTLADLPGAFFAPCSAVEDNRHDQEMGSGGVALVPGTRFAIAGGKTGVTFVLDRAHLGGFRSPCPSAAVYEARTNEGIWGGPVAWRTRSAAFVAIPGSGPAGVRSFRLEPDGRLTPAGKTGERLFSGGESAIVTSDSHATPSSLVLWVLTRPVTGTIYLRAYEATNLHRRLLSVVAGSWSNPNGFPGCTPAVADGRVFVATNKELTIWSLP